MDHPNNIHNNGHSYYQLDPQVTGDQLSSHPSHDLHNAAYPDSDYQPGMGYTPSQGPHSQQPPALSNHNAVGQDSKPYPPVPEPLHDLDSIPNAAYPDSNYRPGAAYAPPAHQHQHQHQPQQHPELSSHDVDHAAYPDSNYRPGAAYSPSHQELLPSPHTVINNAAYPDSNYRPGTSYSATSSSHGPPAGPPPSGPLPNPTKSMQHPPSPSQSPWTNGGESSSSAAAGPSRILVPQATGSEPPPPPYQPDGSESASSPPSRPSRARQPTSPSYSHNENSNNSNPYSGYHASHLNTSTPTRGPRPRNENPIPMTTFPVYQNAIGHVANNSNASSALERNYKEYDPGQAALDAKSRRSNRRKWLIGTLVTTVIVAAVIGVVVALLKKKANDDD